MQDTKTNLKGACSPISTYAELLARICGLVAPLKFFTQEWKSKPVAEFKEFERRFKSKPRLKYGWFHLKLYQMFQDLSRRLI